MTPAEADALIRGITTEAVLRECVAVSRPADALTAIIAALVRRYDRKAEARARKAGAAEA